MLRLADIKKSHEIYAENERAESLLLAEFVDLGGDWRILGVRFT
jgi:hypothetical protein